MSGHVSVCPSALVEAPVERVWDLLMSAEGINSWADGMVVAAEPEGPAAPGQRLELVTRALAWSFAVTIEVLEVQPSAHRLHLLVHLPLGIVNDEVITMASAGEGRTFVQFG